ncbi:hypothetical protein WSM22_25520 [Cytophagales bacterium WSM2-2]|nr:hypothetical protein WSM22_25520 [Cytophagales bacterium WSM2-2]
MKTQLILLISLLTFKIGACQSEYATPSTVEIKILSWNIYMLPGIVAMKGKTTRAEAIGEILAGSEYDVIVFQEAFHRKSRKKIEEALREKFPYQAGPANQKLVSFKTNSGIWIFSKHPILSTRSIIFKNRSGIDAFSRKGALLAEIEINHQRVQVAGTHLQNSGPVWIRQSQCAEFYHRVLKPEFRPDVPQIICGDFNIKKKNEDEYRLMLQSLKATDGELAGDLKFSYDRKRNDLQVEGGDEAELIDYILIRDPVDSRIVHRRILAFQKQWSLRHADLSDHFALEALVQFNTETFVSSISSTGK